MNSSRVLPRLPLLVLVAILMPLLAVSTLHAGGSNKNGNPFSQNGTYFGNSGTFSAIMRGKNLMGVTQFSIFADGAYPSTGWNMLNGQSANTISGQVGLTGAQQNSTTNTFGSPGFVSLYYNGTTYNGPAFSVLDPSAGQIASSFYTYDAGMQLWDPVSTPITQNIVTTNATVTNVATNTQITYYTNTNSIVSMLTNTNISILITTNAPTSITAVTNYSLTTNFITNQTTSLITNGTISMTNSQTNLVTNVIAGNTNVTTNITSSVTSIPNVTTTNTYTQVVQIVTNDSVSYITNTNQLTSFITNTNLTYYYQTNFTSSITAVTNTNFIYQTNLTLASSNITNTNTYGGAFNYYDGYWNASFKNGQQQTFSGSGMISLGLPPNSSGPSPINQPYGGTNIVQISFSVSGTRVSGTTSQIY